MWLALKIGGPAVRAILFRNMALAAYCLKTLSPVEVAEILVDRNEQGANSGLQAGVSP